MDWDTIMMYDEYCNDCHYEGKEPKDFWDWYYDEGE